MSIIRDAFSDWRTMPADRKLGMVLLVIFGALVILWHNEHEYLKLKEVCSRQDVGFNAGGSGPSLVYPEWNGLFRSNTSCVYVQYASAMDQGGEQLCANMHAEVLYGRRELYKPERFWRQPEYDSKLDNVYCRFKVSAYQLEHMTAIQGPQTTSDQEYEKRWGGKDRE